MYLQLKTERQPQRYNNYNIIVKCIYIKAKLLNKTILLGIKTN